MLSETQCSSLATMESSVHCIGSECSDFPDHLACIIIFFFNYFRSIQAHDFNVAFHFFHPILKDGLLNFGCVWLKASNVCAASR